MDIGRKQQLKRPCAPGILKQVGMLGFGLVFEITIYLHFSLSFFLPLNFPTFLSYNSVVPFFIDCYLSLTCICVQYILCIYVYVYTYVFTFVYVHLHM